MPDFSRNHTVFIGEEATINHITSAIDDSKGIFDFNTLYPTPQILELYKAPPVTVISEQEFVEKYGVPCPATIDEFTAFANTQADQLDDVPRPVARHILDTYGFIVADSWRGMRWGTTASSEDVTVTYKDTNILVVSYDTLWSPPEELLDELLTEYPDLQIINGSIIDGITDSVEITHGTETAFHTYFHVDRDVVVYEPIHPNGNSNISDAARPYLNDTTAITTNIHSVETLLAHNCLVDEQGEVDTIKHITTSRRKQV